jgi:hypothetical protein
MYMIECLFFETLINIPRLVCVSIRIISDVEARKDRVASWILTKSWGEVGYTVSISVGFFHAHV